MVLVISTVYLSLIKPLHSNVEEKVWSVDTFSFKGAVEVGESTLDTWSSGFTGAGDMTRNLLKE